MKPLPSYSHCTNHLYAITIVVAVIFVVVSCQHHTPSSLYRVEKRIATHPDSFSNYISAISEAQIDSAQQGNLHTPHCLLTLCCCKAASALQSGKDDSVRYWFVKAGNIVYKYSFSSQPVSMLQRIDTVQMRSCMNEISRAKEMLAQASAYSDVAHYTGNPAFENKSDSLKRVVVKNLYSLYNVLPHYPCNVMYGKSIPHRYVFMGILGCLLLALLLWEHKKSAKLWMTVGLQHIKNV